MFLKNFQIIRCNNNLYGSVIDEKSLLQQSISNLIDNNEMQINHFETLKLHHTFFLKEATQR